MKQSDSPELSPEAIQKARMEALLKRFAGGAQLSKEDRDLVTAELVRRGGPPAVPAETFALRSDLPGPSTYQPYKAYVAVYEVSERSIKTWVARGREAKDWPPLEAPAEMAAWYGRVMNPRIPARLAALAEAPRQVAALESDAPAEPVAPQPALAIDVASLAPLTLEEQADELRRTVTATLHALKQAYAGAHPQTIASRQSAYNQALKTLTQTEAAIEESKHKRGDYVPKAAVEADLATLARGLKALRRKMVDRVLQPLADLPAEIRSRIAAAIEAARAEEDGLFRSAKTIQFPSDVGDLRAA